MSPLILAAGLRAGEDCAAAAAGVALAAAGQTGRDAALLVEVGGRRRGPTLLASDGARECEERLREAGGAAGSAAARGRLCWLALAADEELDDRLEEMIDAAAPDRLAVVALPPDLLAPLADRLEPDAVVLCPDGGSRPSKRPLLALAVAEQLAAARTVKVLRASPGGVAARRARAGLEPGGEAGVAATRLARALAPRLAPAAERREPRAPRRALGAPARERGQALPLALGAIFVCLVCALAGALIASGLTGAHRAQRVADLAAVSAARSMRDDYDRLFLPPLLPSGATNPAHLSREAYLERARAAALEAGRRNAADPARLRVSFPDADSLAPLRVEVGVSGEVESGSAEPASRGAAGGGGEFEADAEATLSVATTTPVAATTASGGGYSGPLVMRQGEGMRPDVAAAYDRMAAAAASDGVALLVNSGFRSDAEQARLFAANPDPRMVAPPGSSLHRCATELDLGPLSAYGWLAANARRFGFEQRYSWEPWHYGFVAGPPPCSAAGEATASAPPLGASARRGGDGGSSASALPGFVPAAYREPIARAATRWNVSAGLLAAQLMAESNFDPNAVSSAGAQGIAQFMPATAAAMGLDDPFDAMQAIDAQARLMADLLEQFGSVELALAAYNAGPGAVAACGCVPDYPETQAYVARILGLMGGVGAIAPQPLEVRLVS